MQICRNSARAVFPYGNKGFHAKKKSRVAALFCAAPKAQPVAVLLTLRCPALPRAAYFSVQQPPGCRSQMQICRNSARAVFPYGKANFGKRKRKTNLCGKPFAVSDKKRAVPAKQVQLFLFRFRSALNATVLNQWVRKNISTNNTVMIQVLTLISLALPEKRRTAM